MTTPERPKEPAVTYRIRHTTTYTYAELVAIAHNEARLVPREGPNQTAHSTRLVVEPAPSFMASERDYFGNWVRLFALEEPHRRFRIAAHSEVTVKNPLVPASELTPPWEQVREAMRAPGAGELAIEPGEALEALQFRFESRHVPYEEELAEYARQSFTPERPLLEAARDLTARIHRDFAYVPGVTSIATPVKEVFQSRRGVCQDFAHLELSCLRSLGLPARYVSGYLLTKPPPGKEKLIGADASHAWISVYCPGHGFIDLDPTNDALVGTDHTTVAWGRDFADVSPLKGVVLGGGAHAVDVAVDVTLV